MSAVSVNARPWMDEPSAGPAKGIDAGWAAVEAGGHGGDEAVDEGVLKGVGAQGERPRGHQHAGQRPGSRGQGPSQGEQPADPDPLEPGHHRVEGGGAQLPRKRNTTFVRGRQASG